MKEKCRVKYYFKIILGLVIVMSNGVFATPLVSNIPIYTATGNVGWATSAVGLSMALQNTGTCSSICQRVASKDLMVDLPEGATVKKAFLYWATDKAQGDSSVLLEGNTVNAQKSWNSQIGTMKFNGYRADVTGIVTHTGSYSFSGIASNATVTYGAACLAGAQLITIYDLPANTNNALERVDIFNGFHGIRGAGLAEETRSEVTIPVDLRDAKRVIVTTMVWQGNAVRELSSFTDRLTVNGISLSGNDTNNGSGANKNNSTDFENTNDGAPLSQYAVDTDTIDITAQGVGRNNLTISNASLSVDFLISQGFVVGYKGENTPSP